MDQRGTLAQIFPLRKVNRLASTKACLLKKEDMMNHALQMRVNQLSRRRGAYGFDEPVWPCLLALLGFLFLAFGLVSVFVLALPILGAICLVSALVCMLSAASYVYTTRRGKFLVWATILLQLELRGDEQILDLGCGRGMVLLMAASLLTSGKAMGIDIWNTHEQSGNALAMTEANAGQEGVAGSVSLHTADMRHLPFSDHSFDLVVSSLAIHNLRDREGYQQTITEAVRVLGPGGRLVIADFRETRHYGECLRALGMSDVAFRPLGWRFWYGGRL